MNRFFESLGRHVVRLRWVIVALWFVGAVAAIAALPSLASQVNDNNGAFLPSSAPSNAAAVLAEPLIGSVNHLTLSVVVVTAHQHFDGADESAVATLLGKLVHVPTELSAHFLALSPDGRAAELLFTSSVSPFNAGKSETVVDDVDTLLANSALPRDLHAYPAGPSATEAASQQQSARQGKEVQDGSVVFIIILLLIIFRSVLAPLITLVPAALVLLLSGSFIGALASAGALQVSFFTQILLIVLILGAGTDYGLFLVFRTREQLRAGAEPHDAVIYALRRVGESITASAATVGVALLTLLFATFGLYHDLGVPLALGVATMLLAGLTLLPALMAIFGRATFWPTHTTPRPTTESSWGRLTARLLRRPWWTLLTGVGALGVIALFALGFVPSGFGGDVNAPAGSTAAAGNAAIAAHFPQASANPTDVVMRFPTSVWTDPREVSVATARLAASGFFKTLSGPLNPAGATMTPAELTNLYLLVHPYGSAQSLLTGPLTPPAGSKVTAEQYDTYLATAAFISANGHTAQWEASLRAGSPGSNTAINEVPALRAAVTGAAHAAGASANGVAGEAPALYDVSAISEGDVGRIVPIAILAIALVLALVLRSLIAPFYLIVSVVLSFLASLGVSVIVFMKIPHETGLVFLLPFLMFIFLLALGEDYNILVMTRIREEATRSDLRSAIVRAVGATGPTVTSAGLVLAGTFVVLAVVGGSGQGNGEIRVIGIGLAIGILLDTFVVRTVLVPATVQLLGRWNWWPSAMGRQDPDAVAEALPVTTHEPVSD
jgi:putative drug exporter of the RND superfamily